MDAEIVRVERYGKFRSYYRLNCARCGLEFFKLRSQVRSHQEYHCCSRECYYSFKKDNDGSFKTCSSCQEKLSLDLFFKRAASHDGLAASCKNCSQRSAGSPKKKAKRETDFRYRLRRAYGLSIEDYDLIFNSQSGACKICGVSQAETLRRLSVDHCHSTGKVRGLLCDSCNTGLGRFKDNEQLLARAISYLKGIL